MNAPHKRSVPTRWRRKGGEFQRLAASRFVEMRLYWQGNATVLATSPRLMTSASLGFRLACVRGVGALAFPTFGSYPLGCWARGPRIGKTCGGERSGARPRGARPTADIVLAKTEGHARVFGNEDFARSGKRARPTSQPNGRARKRVDFFIFMTSNPLKTLDSEKGIKGNKRTFAFVSLLFLAANSRQGCHRGDEGRSKPPEPPRQIRV